MPATEGACLRGARVETVGLATGGTHGLLELALEGAPVVGLPFHLAVRNAAPGAHGVAVLGKHESALFLQSFGATVFPSSPLVALPFT